MLRKKKEKKKEIIERGTNEQRIKWIPLLPSLEDIHCRCAYPCNILHVVSLFHDQTWRTTLLWSRQESNHLSFQALSRTLGKHKHTYTCIIIWSDYRWSSVCYHRYYYIILYIYYLLLFLVSSLLLLFILITTNNNQSPTTLSIDFGLEVPHTKN